MPAGLLAGYYDAAFLALMQAVTPLHVGAGRGGGIVDLAVQRDFAGYPMVPGSSIKGALRSTLTVRHVERRKREGNGEDPNAIIEALFGPPTERAHEFSGSVVFGDLKLLAIPGACGAGICYYTSPMLITYLAYFADLAGIKALGGVAGELARSLSGSKYVVSSEKALVDGKLILADGTIVADVDVEPGLGGLFRQVLERIVTDAYRSVAGWLSERVIAVPESFARILIGMKLLQHVTRIAVDYRRKTIKPGALWTEEYVPELSLFTGVILAGRDRSGKTKLENGFETIRKLANLLDAKMACNAGECLVSFYTILGGLETVGKGIVRLVLWGVRG